MDADICCGLVLLFMFVGAGRPEVEGVHSIEKDLHLLRVPLSPTSKTPSPLLQEAVSPQDSVHGHLESPLNSTKTEGQIVGLEGQGKLDLKAANFPGLSSTVADNSAADVEKAKIHARKGVNFNEPSPPLAVDNRELGGNRAVAVIQALNVTEDEPHKPLLTLDSDGDTEENGESFIESSTTGRDFIFPVVLGILIFPLVVLLVRFLYKRGTEFSERQQYRRMYLIDGMYNSR